MVVKKIFKKIIKSVKSVFFFLNVYSFFGLIGLIIIISVGAEFYDDYRDLIEAYNLILETGEKHYASVYFSTVELFLLLIPAIYYLIFTFYALFTRFRLRRVIKRYGIDFSLTNNTLLILSNNPTLFKKINRFSPLNLFAVLKLRNLSIDSRVVDIKLDRALLKNNEIRFDFAQLDTGVYEIESVRLFLHDYLGLIKCGFSIDYDSPKSFTHIQENQLVYSKEVNTLSRTKLGEKSVMSQDADEGFYANREYQWGDEVKKIHWKNTAKTNKIMIRIPEEVVINKKELSIVLNLYAPLFKKINQQEQLNEFLTEAVEFIKSILLHQKFDTVLYLNGEKTVRIGHLNEISEDRLAETILNYAVFQNEQSFSQFIADNREELEGKSIVAISMSTERIVEDKNINVVPVIYRNSVYYSRPFLEKIKENLTIQFEPDYITLASLFNVKNHRLFLLEPFLKPGFKRKINSNEQFYSNIKDIIWLN